MEDVGETKDNTTEPRRYTRDYWKGVTRAGYGATAWFPARMPVTGPAGYTLNSVGVCTSNTVRDGWRTQVWETDHPVKILNIVGGRWQVRRGDGTGLLQRGCASVQRRRNVATLDAARRWYSEWFLPYPWQELKLSEFPALAGYAQGFGTNITFSENIGFLTKNDAKTDATFLVTAHETAHQWWGNILHTRQRPRRRLPERGDRAFFDAAALRADEGPARPHGVRQGNRGALQRPPPAQRRAPDVRRRRQAPSEIPPSTTAADGCSGAASDFLTVATSARSPDTATSSRLECQPGPPRSAGLRGGDASLRGGSGRDDAFTKQWFEEKVVPQYVVESATKVPSAGGYDVRVRVRNTGTGRMPVEVAAVSGERWASQPGRRRRRPRAGTRTAHQARGTVTLGSKACHQELTVHCIFNPTGRCEPPTCGCCRSGRSRG